MDYQKKHRHREAGANPKSHPGGKECGWHGFSRNLIRQGGWALSPDFVPPFGSYQLKRTTSCMIRKLFTSIIYLGPRERTVLNPDVKDSRRQVIKLIETIFRGVGLPHHSGLHIGRRYGSTRYRCSLRTTQYSACNACKRRALTRGALRQEQQKCGQSRKAGNCLSSFVARYG